MTNIAIQLDHISEAFETPDLSDLFMYNSEFSEYCSIDTGDVITIQCTDGIYRTGEVYSFGKTYTRIIVGTRMFSARMSDDVQMNLRAEFNVSMETITRLVEDLQDAPQIQEAS